MIDKQSVARRALDFEDYIDIAKRNWPWLVGPAFVGLVISTVVAFALPDTFVSQALIRVVPQQISSQLIQDVSQQDIADRVNGMVQTIESRNILTNIITSYGLYKSELKTEPMEDVLTKMQKAISIHPVAGMTGSNGAALPVIQMAFSYPDRYVAQKVCQNLVSRFMDSSTEASFQSEVDANQFLKDEFDQSKRDLDAIELKLADFRQKNAGHLPEEMQTNISEMNALEGRLGSLAEQSTRNTEQRMMLESELRIAKDRFNAIKSPQGQAHSAHVTDLDNQIQQVQARLDDMSRRYTDNYPDLVAAKEQLAALKKERDAALKEKPSENAQAENSGVTRERLDSQGTIDQLQAALKANAMESRQIDSQTAQLSAALRSYQGRVEEVPAGEKEYADLLRDEAIAKERYNGLSIKLEKSSVSMDMERRKQGQTVEQLDQASLPETPAAPKRAMIVPVGAVVGLIIGVVVLALRELRDTSLKNLKDARLYSQLSVLGSIPLLENEVVAQRRRQMLWVSWAAATALGLAIIAGSVAHYYLKRA